jgi:hypothetical protein
MNATWMVLRCTRLIFDVFCFVFAFDAFDAKNGGQLLVKILEQQVGVLQQKTR